MQVDNPVSWLMFFTLAATTFIIAGAFIYFLRSRTNREIAAEALQGDNSRVGATPNGAGPELIGFAVMAIADNETPIMCNGFKDDEYIELVMLAKKIGRQIVPIVEKYS